MVIIAMKVSYKNVAQTLGPKGLFGLVELYNFTTKEWKSETEWKNQLYPDK